MISIKYFNIYEKNVYRRTQELNYDSIVCKRLNVLCFCCVGLNKWTKNVLTDVKNLEKCTNMPAN